MSRIVSWMCLFLALFFGEAVAAEKPTALLQQVLHNILTLDKQVKSDNRDEMFNKLETEVLAYFSFDYMTQWVARPFEQELTETQYQNLTRQLQGLFLTKVLQAFGDSNLEFKVLPPHPYLKERELLIPVQLQQKTPSELYFRLYRNKEGWKIFDLVINQESTMSYFRTYFQQQVKQLGVAKVFGQ